MVVTCTVRGCRNRFVKGGVTFHRYPVDPWLRQRWISFTHRSKWEPKTHDRICGDHFLKGKPSKDPADPDYVPHVVRDSENAAMQRPHKMQENVIRQQKMERGVHPQGSIGLDASNFQAKYSRHSSGGCHQTDQRSSPPHPLQSDSESLSDSDEGEVISDDPDIQNEPSQFGHRAQTSEGSSPSKIGYFETDDQIIGGASSSQLQKLSRKQLWLLLAVLSKEIVRLQAMIHTETQANQTQDFTPEQAEFKVVDEKDPSKSQVIERKTGETILAAHIKQQHIKNKHNCDERKYDMSSATLRSIPSASTVGNKCVNVNSSTATVHPSPLRNTNVIYAFACGHVCRICNSKLKLANLHGRFGSVLPKVAIIPAVLDDTSQDVLPDCPLEMTAETVDRDSSDTCEEQSRGNYIIFSSQKRRWRKSPKVKYPLQGKGIVKKIKTKQRESISTSLHKAKACSKTFKYIESERKETSRSQILEQEGFISANDNNEEITDSSFMTELPLCTDRQIAGHNDLVMDKTSLSKKVGQVMTSRQTFKTVDTHFRNVASPGSHTQSSDKLNLKQFLSTVGMTKNPEETKAHSSNVKLDINPRKEQSVTSLFESGKGSSGMNKYSFLETFPVNSVKTTPPALKLSGQSLQCSNTNVRAPIPLQLGHSSKISFSSAVTNSGSGTYIFSVTSPVTKTNLSNLGCPSTSVWTEYQAAKGQPFTQECKMSDIQKAHGKILERFNPKGSVDRSFDCLPSHSESPHNFSSSRKINLVVGTLNAAGKAEYVLEGGYAEAAE